MNYSKDELLQVFEKIKQMKRHSHFPVVNPMESLNEMQRHSGAEKEKFGVPGAVKRPMKARASFARCSGATRCRR